MLAPAFAGKRWRKPLTKTSHVLVLAIAFGLALQNARAAPPQQPRPEIFTDLLKCRDIAMDSQRLACFDRQVADMQAASDRDEVVILDKAELHKTRRTLFGFSFPKLPFLDGDDDAKKEEEGFSRIQTTIASVKNLGYGKWQIQLEDGAQWMTTEPIIRRTPKAGMTIEIRRASMGSFMGKIEDDRAVRMKRVG